MAAEILLGPRQEIHRLLETEFRCIAAEPSSDLKRIKVRTASIRTRLTSLRPLN
jgi:hypothetical protein